jgi:hypothetical protein
MGLGRIHAKAQPLTSVFPEASCLPDWDVNSIVEHDFPSTPNLLPFMLLCKQAYSTYLQHWGPCPPGLPGRLPFLAAILL